MVGGSATSNKGKEKVVKQHQPIEALFAAAQSSFPQPSPHSGTPPGSEAASSSFSCPHIRMPSNQSTSVGSEGPSMYEQSSGVASSSTMVTTYEPGIRLTDRRLVLRPHGVKDDKTLNALPFL